MVVISQSISCCPTAATLQHIIYIKRIAPIKYGKGIQTGDIEGTTTTKLKTGDSELAKGLLLDGVLDLLFGGYVG